METREKLTQLRTGLIRVMQRTLSWVELLNHAILECKPCDGAEFIGNISNDYCALSGIIDDLIFEGHIYSSEGKGPGCVVHSAPAIPPVVPASDEEIAF